MCIFIFPRKTLVSCRNIRFFVKKKLFSPLFFPSLDFLFRQVAPKLLEIRVQVIIFILEPVFSPLAWGSLGCLELRLNRRFSKVTTKNVIGQKGVNGPYVSFLGQ